MTESGFLQDLPKITINDVHRIIQASSSSKRSEREKGFKMTYT